jgi:hypothetical protein
MKLGSSTSVVIVLIAACISAGGPTVPEKGLYKPTFLRLNGSWSAGTAFVIEWPGRNEPFMVMPDHLFGPDAGLEQQMTPDQIATDVCGAVGLSMQDKQTIIVAGPCVKLPDAHPLGKEGTDKDLEVFPLKPDQKCDVFELAEKQPQNGSPIYMFARLRGETEPKMIPGKVVRSSDSELVYVFDDDIFNAAGTSGAPIIDSDGKVVGMNVDETESKGKQYGFANPASAMRTQISHALKK